MTPEEIERLALEHTTAESEDPIDVDRIMATMVPDPTFAFYPLRRSFTGGEVTRRYYTEGYPAFVRRLAGYQVLDQWLSGRSFVQEYWIDVTRTDGSGVDRFNVVSMMPAAPEAGLLAGETLYCDDELVRALLGPVYDQLAPIG